MPDLGGVDLLNNPLQCRSCLSGVHVAELTAVTPVITALRHKRSHGSDKGTVDNFDHQHDVQVRRNSAPATAHTRPTESSCGEQGGFGTFQEPTGHLSCNGRKALKEFFESVIVFEVVEERLYRHARPLEHRLATEDVGVDRNQVIRVHANSLTHPCLQ